LFKKLDLIDHGAAGCFIILISVIILPAYGQNSFPEKTSVSFYSHATIEDIKAETKKKPRLCLTRRPGDVAFVLLTHQGISICQGFDAGNASVRWITEKFPKSTFQGYDRRL